MRHARGETYPWLTEITRYPSRRRSAARGESAYRKPKHAPRSLFDPPIVKRAILDAFRKLDPRLVAKNPVMFVVEVGSVVTTYLLLRDLLTGAHNLLFNGQITLWLWFTVLFANFAEAMAEGRGKAQADALRKTKTETMARKLPWTTAGARRSACRHRSSARATSSSARRATSSPATAR